MKKFLILCLLSVLLVGCMSKVTIYSEETNGIKNSQLIEIAREFAKNPIEIYHSGIKKFTHDELVKSGKKSLEYVLTNDPFSVRLDVDSKSSLYTGRYVISWQSCWGEELKQDGSCKEPKDVIDIMINKDLKAVSANTASFL